MRKFTREELKKYDGKNGRPAYIAYKGKVYDVSDSHLWHNGEHWGEHSAGQDLTEDLKFAPHGEEVLDRFPIVGELTD
ncbi:MAG TPA: cytochrome B5 [Aquificales bacterium]|nr:cytochrome B5 [Aquificales bacterium]